MGNIIKFFIFLSLISIKSYSIPINPNIASGTLTTENINPNEVNFHVSDKAILNWNDFSINANEVVNFVQPSELATVLNRVTSANQSEIFGKLTANGNIFLINPNGILIGKDATVDTASFLTSTLNLSDIDFLNENYRFVTPGAGTIINYGTITTSNGDVTILGRTIINEGDITANGDFNVGIGEEILLQPSGSDKILINTKLQTGDGFTNTKLIKAIKHEIKADGNLNSYAINLDGEISKEPTVQTAGRFYLSATNGKVTISKFIKQDNIDITSQEITIQKEAVIEAKTNGSIDITSKDQIQIDGLLKAPAGSISITNENNANVCFNMGEIDVSSNIAGTIDITIAKFINTGSIKADSKTAIGGKITINTDNFIEVEKALISAKSDLLEGGLINIFANDNFFTSGQYNVNGKTKGGSIQISTNTDNLHLASCRMHALGNQKGSILLNSNNQFTQTPNTILNGDVQHNFKSLSLGAISFTTSELIDPNAGGGSGFGSSIVALSGGNVVVTKPNDNSAASNAGAVYLYNGNSLALISTLLGSSANNTIGSSGVTELTNGNYVIKSPLWDDGVSTNVGAATWGNGTTGISGTLSSSNSLVGSTASDQVSVNGVTALTNGNYVVSSTQWNNTGATDAGAATWGNGTTGISEVVDNINSLVGTRSSDTIGSSGIVALTNGNYVVGSSAWDNLPANVGAATWGNGTTGVSGDVSAANSLVGTTTNEQIGTLTALTNGNYVVTSDPLVVAAGSATFGDGSTGITGDVTSLNSLVGTTSSDNVGSFVLTLTNGNYVIVSIFWDNVGAVDAGAATWCNGTTADPVGAVSSSNSIVGSTASDRIGSSGRITLTNGNYVVSSQIWDDGVAVIDAGAVTWGNGSTAGPRTVGAVSSSNSLIGSTASDEVGVKLLALTNGNYVVSSSKWNNGAIVDAGAVTLGDGTNGTTGFVTTLNSLVGTTADDQVGFVGTGKFTALTNGNYVVSSQFWNGAVDDVGAATWCNGTTADPVGAVSSSNSLVGTMLNDHVSETVILALTNGNYVVLTNLWDATSLLGAATWGEGSTAGPRTVGAVSSSNSLVGSVFGDVIGSSATALSNGNFVVVSNFFDAFTSKGAVTFGDGTNGTSGVVSSSNSLVGSTNSDGVGSGGITTLSLGNYLVESPNWDDGALTNAGAATLGDGTNGTLGVITSTNSVLGTKANAGLDNVVEETVFSKAYIHFANEESGGGAGSSGRIIVMQLSIPTPTPTPTPSVTPFSFDQKVKISNTTFVARSELFRNLHPYNEYIKEYLQFSIDEKLYPIIFEKKSNRFYLVKGKLYDTITLQKYFIRQRNDEGISSMQEPKTL